MASQTPTDFSDFEGEDIDRLTQRIEHILDSAAVNCVCQERLHDALRRFADLEINRVQRRALTTARDQRLRIASILSLMAELEDLNVNEVDTSVFMELAYLFDDVASSAHLGATAMRRLALGSSQA
uniref:hypothetical protein n=1 Tax=Pararhizobium sp. IMCC3301 TaxID=3067904 RepID=UPI002740A40C|nr:hypothetical protein [Pararhizobium sp. IMCC3301]